MFYLMRENDKGQEFLPVMADFVSILVRRTSYFSFVSLRSVQSFIWSQIVLKIIHFHLLPSAKLDAELLFLFGYSNPMSAIQLC